MVLLVMSEVKVRLSDAPLTRITMSPDPPVVMPVPPVITASPPVTKMPPAEFAAVWMVKVSDGSSVKVWPPLIFRLLMVIPTWLAWRYSSDPMFWAWTAATVNVVFLGIGFMFRFRGGKWQEMQVIEPDVTEELDLETAPAIANPLPRREDRFRPALLLSETTEGAA